MYQYDPIDQLIVEQRVAQFRDQTGRFLAGEIGDAQFLPLRLQNGLYREKHAHMLRVAIPYGLMSSRQLRRLAHIARTYDRGTAHFTTRQNLQLNWPVLEDVPEILAQLAEVHMHAIQTSGSCVRNITTDQFAGVAPDEITDPLPWAELVRQWSTLHPEFAFLPRKFKIAISGAQTDRAVTLAHDIGIRAKRGTDGQIGFRIVVGGGLGRTPVIGRTIREFLPWPHLLTYLDAILRIYNRHGRRDNKYKARLKILVKDLGVERFRQQVEEEWAHLAGGPGTVPHAEIERIRARFLRPAYRRLGEDGRGAGELAPDQPAFRRWMSRNVHPHRVPGYVAVTLSLKKTGVPPGDLDAARMDAVADLADRYSFGEIRVTHEQNLVFAHTERSELPALWRELGALGLATPNVGLLTDVVCCPGGDYCSLANAVSIPVAEAVQRRFEDLDYLHDIGELDLNISGCINACGQHHVGHIGILGVSKAGEEWYQVTLGGRQGDAAAIGQIIGPAFARDEVPDVVERLVVTYLDARESPAERFVDVVQRIGIGPFREAVYAHAH